MVAAIETQIIILIDHVPLDRSSAIRTQSRPSSLRRPDQYSSLPFTPHIMI